MSLGEQNARSVWFYRFRLFRYLQKRRSMERSPKVKARKCVKSRITATEMIWLGVSVSMLAPSVRVQFHFYLADDITEWPLEL